MNLSSQTNQHLKLARRVRDGKERKLIFVEGTRLVSECLRANLQLECAFALSTDADTSQLLSQIAQRGCPIFAVEESLLKTLSDTVTSQGLILLAQRPHSSLEDIFREDQYNSLLVALDRIQDPGNAGTIVRTAEAAGASVIVSSTGTVDLFSPKALRSSMGSAFRLPIAAGASLNDLFGLCRSRSVAIVGTASEADLDYAAYDWREPTLVIFGNEAAGLSADVLAACDALVKIPLTAPVESLNVASAAAVILFEAARQRTCR